jgi:tetratricopeptide (TPR) repeat protein
MRARWVVGTLLALTLVATAWSGYGLEQKEDLRGDPDLLYLPNGKLLKVVALGHGPVVADALYLWAIQYYSNYEREDRYRYVEHVFSNVIAELDPHYIDAYWMGSLILIIEADELDAGLRLLELGFEHNPQEWILPYLAGWESYRAGRATEAQDYFRQAMQVEDAPAVLGRLVAGVEARKGDPRKAIALWQSLLDDPDCDRSTRKVGERQLRQLREQVDVQSLTDAVTRFRNDNGRLPRSLEELRSERYIRSLPRNPAGAAYVYDPASGRVSSPAGRILGDS